MPMEIIWRADLSQIFSAWRDSLVRDLQPIQFKIKTLLQDFKKINCMSVYNNIEALHVDAGTIQFPTVKTFSPHGNWTSNPSCVCVVAQTTTCCTNPWSHWSLPLFTITKSFRFKTLRTCNSVSATCMVACDLKLWGGLQLTFISLSTLGASNLITPATTPEPLLHLCCSYTITSHKESISPFSTFTFRREEETVAVGRTE